MLKTRNFLTDKCSIGGIPLKGGGTSEFVRVELDEEPWSIVKGIDGEETRNRNPNRSGTITITCMSTSKVNAYLNAAYLADVGASDSPVGNISGILPNFSYSEKGDGNADFFAEQVFIKGIPNLVFGKEATEHTWTLHFSDYVESNVRNGADNGNFMVPDFSTYAERAQNIIGSAGNILDLFT